VKANQGAAGMEGRAIDAFPEVARQHWERLRSALAEGTDRPAAVLRVMIRRPPGGHVPWAFPPGGSE
jgi:RNA-directed DNA polymerase